MMMRTTAAAAFSALFALCALAQEPPPPPTFQERVEVRVMDLDVVVTDSKGQPVTDLSREDFRVRVDGKDVPIDYFARVDEGAIHAPDLASASPDRILEEFRRGEQAYVPRHFLIFFDVGHLSPGTRQRALEGLRDLVTRLGPGDSGRVVLFDRRVRELMEWTSSKEALLGALSQMEKGVGMSRLLTERQTLQQIDSTRSRSTRASLARSYAEQERAEIERLLEDMGSEMTTLAPLPGKKVFLFVSGGFDYQPGYAMTAYAVGTIGLPTLDIRNVSERVEELARRANASEITFYTVDARGLTAEGGSAADDEPLANRPRVAFLARQDSQTGLINLARETGGVPLLNSNDFQGGLSRVYRDVSTYYSIGVNLGKLQGPGYRNVRVEVTGRPNLVVRARRGFDARTDADQIRDRAAATLRTNITYQSFPVTLRTAPPTKGKKYYELPISVSVPASALTFVPAEGKARATAEIYVGAMDDKGRTSPISREETTFEIPAGQASGDTPVLYNAKLQTRKGNHHIVVNVRDKMTGRMGTAKADIRVE
jgi:VWFA-related protein